MGSSRVFTMAPIEKDVLPTSLQPELAPHALLSAWLATRDEQTFAALVDRYAPMVRSVCKRVLQDGDQTEDAVQETFILLARHAARIRSNVGGWLMATARTTAIDILQQGRARRRRELLAGDEHHQSMQARLASPAFTADDLTQLDQAMQTLPEGERSVLIDYFWCGRTQDDIGREAGVSQVAIKKRIDRALENLRSRLVRFSPAALLLLLAAAAPSAEGAGEAALLAKLKTSDLHSPPPSQHLGYQLAPVAVGILIALALFIGLSAMARQHVAPSPVNPQAIRTSSSAPPAQPPPPDPRPWSDGWTTAGVSVETIAGDAMRLDSGVQKIGMMTRPMAGDGLDLDVQVVKRHCPFFGVSLVPGDSRKPLIRLGIVPNPAAPDAACWTRTPGEHHLSMRVEQADGGLWAVCAVDGAAGLRQKISAQPTQVMLVVSSGQVVIRKSTPLQQDVR